MYTNFCSKIFEDKAAFASKNRIFRIIKFGMNPNEHTVVPFLLFFKSHIFEGRSNKTTLKITNFTNSQIMHAY